MTSKKSTSSQADSPANLFRLRVSGKLKPIRVGSGRSSYASCLRYDPASSLWRTYPDSSIEGWPASSVIFPRAGIMRNGVAYRRPMSVRRTSENGSLSWRTPSAEQAGDNEGYLKTLRDKDGGPPRPGRRVYNPKDGKHIILTLNRQVKLWPTPPVSDTTGVCPPGHHRKHGAPHLKDMMLPTPTATRWSGLQSHGKNAILGQLNPTWVEWLMGFPLGWTDLEDSETPSSRKSRSGSDESC